MNYKSYKNRRINEDRNIEVYRCVSSKSNVYSIRQDRLLVGYTIDGIDFNMRNCNFVSVKADKTAYCQTDDLMKMHSFIVGKVTNKTHISTSKPKSFVELDPRSVTGFVSNGNTVEYEKYVTITSNGIYL